MADTAQELTSGLAAPPPPPPSCTLPFIFYPILGRKRFGEATIPRPPSVLQPAIGALRVCLRFRKPPKFVTIYQNASGEISTRHWASHNDHAHRCLRNMLKGRRTQGSWRLNAVPDSHSCAQHSPVTNASARAYRPEPYSPRRERPGRRSPTGRVRARKNDRSQCRFRTQGVTDGSSLEILSARQDLLSGRGPRISCRWMMRRGR